MPRYSIDNPPPQIPEWKKKAYLVPGLLFGAVAAVLGVGDALAHLTVMPFDDVIFHGAAALFAVPAAVFLGAVWRGYHVSGKGITRTTVDGAVSVARGARSWVTSRIRRTKPEHHEHTHWRQHEEYDGSGYPRSSVTYAKENLNGRYGSSKIRKAVSRAVIALGYPAHVIGGAIDRASRITSNIWQNRSGRLGVFDDLLFKWVQCAFVGAWEALTSIFVTREGHRRYREAYANGDKMFAL